MPDVGAAARVPEPGARVVAAAQQARLAQPADVQHACSKNLFIYLCICLHVYLSIQPSIYSILSFHLSISINNQLIDKTLNQ